MANIIQLGGFYLNGRPAKIGCQFDKGTLTFGNNPLGKKLSWVRVGNILVSTRTICTNISWDQLNSMGYIFGTDVSIDGMSFLCRSLKVGDRKNVSNEWDTILDTIGKKNSLWKWKDILFWGQETSVGYDTSCAVRGCYSARSWSFINASSRHEYIGFRPVLEILNTVTLFSNSLIGTRLRAYGPTGFVDGTLTDFNDYDLFMVPSGKKTLAQHGGWYCQQSDGTIVVNRGAIKFLQNQDIIY